MSSYRLIGPGSLVLALYAASFGMLWSSSVLAGGETITGEALNRTGYGPGIVESMEEVVARDRAAPPRPGGRNKDVDHRYGEWVVPTRGATSFPFSGEHYVVNKWGDIRIGIGFPELVDVHGAYFAGQAAAGAWTTGLRVVGYAQDEEVARTDWFRNIGEEPAWFEMDLCGVDRIVLVAQPVLEGGGWYGLDDLTYSVAGPSRRGPTVVDFDDLNYRAVLSGTQYAGLTWEFGTGSDLSDAMPPPGVPPGMARPTEGSLDEGVASGRGAAADLGTPPDLDFGFQGVIRGDAGSWSYPPDTCGAVGPDHFVIVVNRNFAVFDKATGTEQMNVLLGSFQPGTNGDPRVLFDHHSQRWIVLSTDFSGGANIYLAVSSTSDPMGNWFKTSFLTAQGADTARWPDYPTLGVDVNGIYTSAYMVGASRMTLFAIDKAPLVAPIQSLGTITAFRNLPWEGAIQPVHTFGDPGGEYCVSGASSTTIRVRKVHPPLTAPTLTEEGLVPKASHSSPPDATARGSGTPLDTVGSRYMMAVYRNGSIWTTHTVGAGSFAACRWYEIDTGTMAIAQTGTITGASINYFFPSIMVNERGYVAMGFTGSNALLYPGAYYVGRAPTDPLGEMSPPVLYKPGSAAQNNIDQYGRNRWGDYSLTTLDPRADTRIWTLQEYGHGEDVWGTSIGVLRVGDCNGNLLYDDCDVDCGVPGGLCDVAGCGLAADCDANGVPDACESVVGACCFPDGSCCDRLSTFQCGNVMGTMHSGIACVDMVDPACVATSTRIDIEPAVVSALPGGLVSLDLTVDQIAAMAGYQVSIQITRLSGTGTLAVNCVSCSGGYNDPGCGVRIDDTRLDYVFEGHGSVLADANCPNVSLGAVLSDGTTEMIDPIPGYLGELLLGVSQDATVGTQFEVSLIPTVSETFLLTGTMEAIPYVPGTTAIVTVTQDIVCTAPAVVADGCRTVLVTPSGTSLQALLVTGDGIDSEVSCVSTYIQADGTLGPNPVFLRSDEWATIDAHGAELIPSKTYHIQADCGSPGSPNLSPTATTTTWVWGDVQSPPDGDAGFLDILLIVQAFKEDYSVVTMARADIEPCIPDRAAGFLDALDGVKAFKDQLYTDDCPAPCQP